MTYRPNLTLRGVAAYVNEDDCDGDPDHCELVNRALDLLFPYVHFTRWDDVETHRKRLGGLPDVSELIQTSAIALVCDDPAVVAATVTRLLVGDSDAPVLTAAQIAADIRHVAQLAEYMSEEDREMSEALERLTAYANDLEQDA